MKKSERIKSIIEIQNRQEQQALQVLVKQRGKIQDIESQLNNLQEYKQDYLNKHAQKGEASLSIHVLMEFRAFISKLDQAIEGQQKTLEQAKNERDKYQREWEKFHQKVTGLQKICDKALANELHIQQRAEQVEQDERASRSINKNGMSHAKR